MNASQPPARRGVVLVLISGIIALLAVLSAAFLVRMGQEAAGADDLMRLAQNRLSLHAGMSYIQESSRLGYAVMNADGSCANPREGWGWIDPRVVVPGTAAVHALETAHHGGQLRIGPFDAAGNRLWSDGAWPAPGSVLRVPFHRLELPPWAVWPTQSPNPLPIDHSKPTFGVPFFTNPDPRPFFDNPSDDAAFDPTAPDPNAVLPSDTSRTQRQAWSQGKAVPSAGSLNIAWFRIYRERGDESGRPAAAGPVGSTFIITVGSAGTLGFSNWAEVVASGAQATFNNSSDLYDELQGRERRQWYRVAWSSAVGGGEDLLYVPALAQGSGAPAATGSFYAEVPVNASRALEPDTGLSSSPAMGRNYGGTIRYIQRLDAPPAAW
jgi:hypothetical protein